MTLIDFLPESLMLTIVSSLVTFLATKKKYKADVRRSEMEAVQLFDDIMKSRKDNLLNELQILQAGFNEIKKVNEELKSENLELSKRIYLLEKEIINLQNKWI